MAYRVRGMRRTPRQALGDAEPEQGSVLSSMTSDQLARETLVTLRGVRQDIADRLEREETQKWVQIAATLSIPLAAWAWKNIFRRFRNKSAS